MRSRLRRPLAASTALLLAVLCAAAAEEPRDRARRLAEQAFAAIARADGRTDGWEAGYEEAERIADEAARADPKYPDAPYAAFVALGRRAERSGKTSQMASLPRLKELLDRTLELDPRHAHAWEAKGEMLMQLPWLMGGSEKGGVEALERSAELAPRWAKPRLRLAEHHLRKGDLERARVEAEKARELAREARDAELETQSSRVLAEIASGEG